MMITDTKTFTFAQHMSLAREWVRLQGRQGSDRQALAAMYQHTAPELQQLLTAAHRPVAA
jgi:hypothetical protein